jgi:hypothetical protein
MRRTKPGKTIMSKVMQIYGLTVHEALQLSNGQVQLMLEHAATTAAALVKTNNEFQQSLGDRLAPMKRAVRAALDDGLSFGTSSTTADEGTPIGRPPSL